MTAPKSKHTLADVRARIAEHNESTGNGIKNSRATRVMTKLRAPQFNQQSFAPPAERVMHGPTRDELECFQEVMETGAFDVEAALEQVQIPIAVFDGWMQRFYDPKEPTPEDLDEFCKAAILGIIGVKRFRDLTLRAAEEAQGEFEELPAKERIALIERQRDRMDERERQAGIRRALRERRESAES